jgi:OmpA-OmpF porin, OOP family
MASKKFKLLLGLLILLGSSAFSQTKGGYNPYDTSVIPSKRLPQQNEFWNNSYSFPAKPRNMWEVGVSGGTLTESSDVPSVFPTFGFGVHVRKALGYIFSVRLDYINGYAKGLNWNGSNGYGLNPAWNGQNNPGQAYTGIVYYNYKAHIQDLSLEGIITLNNVRFHKEKTGLTFYGGAGFGATIFKTMINALDANGHNYQALFTTISSTPSIYSNRKKILDALKAGMDNTYETNAETEAGGRRPKIGDNTLKPSGTVIAGVAYKLSDRINIALEDRWTFVKTDLLDGQRWSEYPGGAPTYPGSGGSMNVGLTGDFDSYNFGSLGINFNLGSKAVEPLWWINPLDYAYSELNNPKHMKLPKPVFDDADGDGVVDQLDREPNTPAGCPVDTHGVSKDTDGDGVPDCKDKQLITPTECQPVDADGVGKCPDPSCCAANKALIDSLIHHTPAASCPSDYPSISFKDKSVALGKDAKALAETVASKLKSSPTCTITLTAYPGTSKAQQSLAETRLNAVKKYLVEKLGISEDRISTDKVIGGGDEGTIDIKAN